MPPPSLRLTTAPPHTHTRPRSLAFAIVVPVTGPDGSGGISFMGTSDGSKSGRGMFMSV